MDSFNPKDIKLVGPTAWERFLILAKTYKIPFAVGGVLIVMLVAAGGVSIVERIHKNTPPSNQPTTSLPPQVLNPKTASRSATYKFIYNPYATAAPNQPAQTTTGTHTALVLAPSPYNLPDKYAAPILSQIKALQNGGTTVSSGTSGANTSGGSSSSGTSGAVNSGSSTGTNTGSNQSGSSGSDGTSDTIPVTIYFQDPNGNIVPYVAPTNPPYAIPWLRYTNSQDHYSIDYPGDWPLIKTSNLGHEGLNLFPPGEDTNDVNAFRIGVGWNTKYYLPAGTSDQVTLRQPIFISGQNGTLFTQGTIGESYVAAVLPDHNGQFGMVTNASTDLLLYVFIHMLESVTIN